MRGDGKFSVYPDIYLILRYYVVFINNRSNLLERSNRERK